MKTTLLSAFSVLIIWNCLAQKNEVKTVSRNNMNVSWHFEDGRVFLEMEAPTQGWITIGFNTHSGIENAYLLMGNVVSGKANVVEHYTLSPGNYKSIASLGAIIQVSDVEGLQTSDKTILKFSLPVKANSKFQKELSEGKFYHLSLAYSREDNFQHHSIMRTSVQVKL